MNRGWARHALLAVLSVTLSILGTCGALLAGDLFLHHRAARTAGVNMRGYRGPIVGAKRPGETRVVVLGGSTAFGYGVGPDASFPALLERAVNARRAHPGMILNVVNLGYNNEGAHAFRFTLEDYRRLGYDGVVLYEGYNDLGGHNTSVFRHDSPIFKLTGYLPIFPMILKEKAMALRYGGNLEAAYEGRETVFRPNLAERATAATLEVGAKIGESLERQVGRLTPEPVFEAPAGSSMDCQEPWRRYCQDVRAAIEYARGRGAWVLVVTQPYLSDRHVEQQRCMTAMLTGRFGRDARVRHVNLGRGVVALNDPTLCYDGMHLTAAGNARIAQALAEPVVEAINTQ